MRACKFRHEPSSRLDGQSQAFDGGHGAFRAQAARLRRVPEDDLRELLLPPGIRAEVSPWRVSCHAASCAKGDALVEQPRRLPDAENRTTRSFRAVVSSRPLRNAGTLGVDGWAPTVASRKRYRPATTIARVETATRGAVRFPRLVKTILRHALAR